MSSKAIALEAEQIAAKDPDNVSALEKLDCVESSLLGLLQEIKSIRYQIQKQVNKSTRLEALLEAEDVAKIIGVDVGYIYQLARAAKIPSIKLGKYRKFSPSQIRKWLDRKNNS